MRWLRSLGFNNQWRSEVKTDHPDLENPTVADVIAFLQKLDPKIPFLIEDPDTSWTISKINAYEEDGAIWFTGTYGDMEAYATA